MVMPYQGISTFLKSEYKNIYKPLKIFGVPFDSSVSFRSGSRMGPSGIRKSSMMLTDGDHPDFNIDPSSHVTDMGDIETGSDINRSLKIIEETVVAHHSKEPLFFMGGDHSITLGILRGLKQHHEKISVLHLDAHCDTWKDNFGEPIGHGTWVYNAIQEGLVDPRNIVSVGLRSPVDGKTKNWLRSLGGYDCSSRDLMKLDLQSLSHEWRKRLFETDEKLYISFDIDVLDPAYAPGTGTPEIGGLSPIKVFDILDCFKDDVKHRLIGMDLVECNPSFDHGDITTLAGATYLWHIMAMYLVGK